MTFDNWELFCDIHRSVAINTPPVELSEFKNFTKPDYYSYEKRTIDHEPVNYCYDFEEDFDEYESYLITEVDNNSDGEEEFHYYYEF